MDIIEQRINEEARKRRKKPAAKPHSVIIKEQYCKGCSICVNVCPTGVLVIEETPKSIFGLIAKIDKPDYCIGCMLCELHCPDFAIIVDYEKRKVDDE
jgi:NAD-dependent dihydropyrimidine dehydrogenase PreA subunit